MPLFEVGLPNLWNKEGWFYDETYYHDALVKEQNDCNKF